MSARVTVRRAASGLGLLGLLAAAVVPVFAVAATAHRAHWAGVGGESFWSGLLVPWAGRCWAAVILLAVVGWAAGAAPPEPGRGRRMAAGAGLGALAAGLCLLAALPAWVWLLRLGAADAIFGRALLAGLVPLAGGVLAGALGPAAGEAGGALVGAAAGAGVLWAVWSGFA